LATSQPTSRKLPKVLERDVRISRSRDAQRRPCRLESAPLGAATVWPKRYADLMEARFQNLDDLLEELKHKEKRHGKKK